MREQKPPTVCHPERSASAVEARRATASRSDLSQNYLEAGRIAQAAPRLCVKNRSAGSPSGRAPRSGERGNATAVAVRRTSISAYSRTAHAYNKYIRALWAHNYFTIPLATLSSKNALILPVFCRTFPILKYKFVGSFCAFCTILSQDPASRPKTTKFRRVFAARSTPFQTGAAATHPLTVPASAPRFAKSDPITAPHRASRCQARALPRLPALSYPTVGRGFISRRNARADALTGSLAHFNSLLRREQAPALRFVEILCPRR